MTVLHTHEQPLLRRKHWKAAEELLTAFEDGGGAEVMEIPAVQYKRIVN